MKKFIITESEKKRILSQYGIIREETNQELLDFGNNYIDSNNCEKIYEDLSSFKSAVEKNQVQMSEEDKYELDENLRKIKTYKNIFCGRIKKEMKNGFVVQSQSNPEKLKNYLCWFASNITKIELNSCKPVNQTPVEPIDKETDNDNTNTIVTNTNGGKPTEPDETTNTVVPPIPEYNPQNQNTTKDTTNKTQTPTVKKEEPISPSSESPKPTSSEKKYDITYPGDKNYRYSVSSDGHWWAKNINNNKEFELTGDNFKSQFQTSIDNLDKKYPDARPSNAPKKQA